MSRRDRITYIVVAVLGGISVTWGIAIRDWVGAVLGLALPGAFVVGWFESRAGSDRAARQIEAAAGLAFVIVVAGYVAVTGFSRLGLFVLALVSVPSIVATTRLRQHGVK
jgi:hypothetical protein